jgi:hypothetical protein
VAVIRRHCQCHGGLLGDQHRRACIPAQVLEALGCSIDVSADAFPYLGCREGDVAGVPARLMRVGFVGELGYELHVPSLFAAALWDSRFRSRRAMAHQALWCRGATPSCV